MIKVTTSDKVRISRSGANKLFGIDYKTRKNMEDNQLLELFDDVWENRLRYLVEGAEVVSQEEVNRRLLDKYHSFVDPGQEKRSFHYAKAEFIAQLRRSDSKQYELTQLWRVASSDTYPNTLFVTFNDATERNRFATLARKLRKNDEDLALKLMRNFMDLADCADDEKEDLLDDLF